MVHGFDLSDINGEVEWEKIPAHQLPFVYLKASDGINNLDKRFNVNRQKAKANGILTGAYHWLNPKLNCKQQAEFFVNVVGNFSGELPPAVCLELYRTSINDMEKNVRLFIDTLVNFINRKPIIYTSIEYWTANLPKAHWACQYPLWIDAPGRKLPSQLYPWASWTFWQYSYKDLIPGVNGYIGVNRFNGNMEELQNLVYANKDDVR